MKPGPKPRPLAERFWEKVTIGAEADCWPWRATRLPTGYGQFDKEGAHRVAYRLTHGEIPEGAHICHTCDNPPCVNPAHLYAGSSQTNQADMVGRGRSNYGERHWNAHLSAEQIAAIRADSRISRLIAEEYGVSASHIRRIKRGEQWDR